MLPLINKRYWTRVAMPLLTLLCVTACNNEPTAPTPGISQAPVPVPGKPTDFKGWMKLHENELTSARLAYQTAKAKHILPGQLFDKNAFDADYKTALRAQGMALGKLPDSVQIPATWNATRQTTAQYLDAHRVQGALKQYILTLEQSLKKAGDKLIQEHNATNRTARIAAEDDDWGPSEEQTLGVSRGELEYRAEAAYNNSGISDSEKEAIWMVTGMVINFLPEFMTLTKQELGFNDFPYGIIDGQSVQGAFGPRLGRLLRRLFNVVTTVVIITAALVATTVAMVAATTFGTPLITYLGVIYSQVVGRLIGGMFEAISGNQYVCVFLDDGGRC